MPNEKAKHVTITNICKYSDNGAEVTVACIEEEPDSLYIARKVYRKVESDNDSNLETIKADVKQCIFGVFNTTDYSHLPLEKKYMCIIRDNSGNSVTFPKFKQFMGSLMPKDHFAWHDYEYTSTVPRYGGSYGSPGYR
jgi:hypothetical protein